MKLLLTAVEPQNQNPNGRDFLPSSSRYHFARKGQPIEGFPGRSQLANVDGCLSLVVQAARNRWCGSSSPPLHK